MAHHRAKDLQSGGIYGYTVEMKQIPNLETATFIKRYKRFFADIETTKGPLTIHVPNTGSMKGCLNEGAPCLYTPTDDPNRKLKGTLQFLKTESSWVGVNTSLPNGLVQSFWESGQNPAWKNFKFCKMEHKIHAKTRLDMVLAPSEEDFKEGQSLHFVEIKNVTMADNGVALFPDAVTTRGQKHLEELMELKDQGFGAEIFFVIQRTDCKSFSPCEEIDPEYARLLRVAHDQGVQVSAFPCWIDEKKGVGIANSPLKIQL